jgi:hypothetical protein|tara:strand:+ start:1697 stop:1972 length:276 start_codon:yes stop_codon:yes gene_type:complete
MAVEIYNGIIEKTFSPRKFISDVRSLDKKSEYSHIELCPKAHITLNCPSYKVTLEYQEKENGEIIIKIFSLEEKFISHFKDNTKNISRYFN